MSVSTFFDTIWSRYSVIGIFILKSKKFMKFEPQITMLSASLLILPTNKALNVRLKKIIFNYVYIFNCWGGRFRLITFRNQKKKGQLHGNYFCVGHKYIKMVNYKTLQY